MDNIEIVLTSGWVARDKNGNLHVYRHLPYRRQRSWCGEPLINVPIFYNSPFSDLTWESDPIEIELIVKRKNKLENHN